MSAVYKYPQGIIVSKVRVLDFGECLLQNERSEI